MSKLFVRYKSPSELLSNILTSSTKKDTQVATKVPPDIFTKPLVPQMSSNQSAYLTANLKA